MDSKQTVYMHPFGTNDLARFMKWMGILDILPSRIFNGYCAIWNMQ